jgi:hypothetical protein
MSINVGRYLGSPLAPTAAYLTQNYEPTRTASGVTIQRQAPEGERDRSHDGEYRVTAPDGRDLGWHLNFASAMAAADAP